VKAAKEKHMMIMLRSEHEQRKIEKIHTKYDKLKERVRKVILKG